MVTINSIDSNIPIEISKGGTNSTSLTSNGVLYYDGTSLVTTAAGTTGQVLTSNGAGVAPTYAAVPASVKMILISKIEGAGQANISFTGMTAYSHYKVILSGINNSSNSRILQMLVSNDNGANYLVTGYKSGALANAGGTATNITSTIAVILGRTVAAANNSSNAYILDLYNINQVLPFLCTGMGGTSDGSAGGISLYISAKNTNTNINAIRFSFSFGNISGGEISLYGVVP